MLAFILAAGFGTRFRPATLTLPKPLLPFLGRPILFRLFDHLLSEGVDGFVVNGHHLASLLETTVGDSYRGCPVSWSREEPILGTAGAIRRAAEAGLLDAESFLVVNGDLFTTLGLGRLLKARRDHAVVSALAVVPNERPDIDTPLWGGADGELLRVGGARPAADATGPWLFTGIQAARRALVERIPAGFSEFARHVLQPSCEKRDGAFVLVPYVPPKDGLWFDLGTPARLAEAELAAGSALTDRSADE